MIPTEIPFLVFKTFRISNKLNPLIELGTFPKFFFLN